MCACAAAYGCESAEEKCRKVRDDANSALQDYVAALERARSAAAATQSETHAKLTGEVEPRLSPAAQKAADSRYDRSSEAWARAHTIALNDACAKDAECRALKRKNADARTLLADLDERLPLARAAQTAAGATAEEAAKAAAATIVHPEYPQLKRARELAAQAVELCKDVPHAPATAAPGSAR